MFDRCLYFNTNRLSRMVGKVWNDAYRELELAPAHAYLLRLVLDEPGLSQKEIGEALHLEKSTVTRFIDKMVEQDYLKRCYDSQPGIFPTAKSKKIHTRLNEIGNELYKNMQQSIGKDNLSQLVALSQLASEKL